MTTTRTDLIIEAARESASLATLQPTTLAMLATFSDAEQLLFHTIRATTPRMPIAPRYVWAVRGES